MNNRILMAAALILMATGVAPGQQAPAAITPDAVKAVKQATVYLKVTDSRGQFGEGSGFLAGDSGIVITNAHVLGMLNASSKTPAKIEVVLHSGQENERQMTGKVLGVDRAADLAVVRVEEKDLPTPLPLGVKEELYETQKVYIFGFPFGAQLGKNITVSESSISSVRTKGGVIQSIQVNGGMHPGNSGGPVVDSLGRVVGVSVSVIRNTQINFAIPAASVQALFAGRIMEAKAGELFRAEDTVRVPVTYKTLDPFKRIREIRVDVWAGKPATNRPFSAAKATPQPDDGSRHSHVLKYEKQTATADVPLPKLEAGQVAWVQPVIIFEKGEAFDAPQAFDAALAVERVAADLVIKLAEQKERTVHLKTAQSTQVTDGKQKITSADKAEVDLVESFGPNAQGALVRIGFAVPKLLFEDNGAKAPPSPQVASVLQRIPPVFVVDGANKLRSRTDVNLNPQMPQVLREQVGEFYLQICNAYESTNLILPNREVEPRESWDVSVPLLLKVRGKSEVVDLKLTCTYEGLRTRADNREAVVRFSGSMQSRNAAMPMLDSQVSGKFTFDDQHRYISQAKLTIASESSSLDGRVHASFAFDVDLTRKLGNPLKIELPKASQGGTLQAEVLVKMNGALGPKDDLDAELGGRGSRAKTIPLAMTAGKSYSIRLSSDAFDCFLRLIDPSGKVVAQDDDSGGGLNSRIDYVAKATGQFKIVATSFDGGLGAFRLQVHGEKEKEKPAKDKNTPEKEDGKKEANDPRAQAGQAREGLVDDDLLGFFTCGDRWLCESNGEVSPSPCRKDDDAFAKYCPGVFDSCGACVRGLCPGPNQCRPSA
jgi:S1-C subfamily serine protease